MTYNQLWHSLTSIYDEGEAKAIVRTVLDVVFGLSMADVCSGKVTQLSEEECSLLEEMMHRLQKCEPVQYVTGVARFGGRTFRVRPGVLVPRPETEELCHRISSILRAEVIMRHPPLAMNPSESQDIRPARIHLLDIGTGSGCIAATLALDCPETAVTAWDLSSVALTVARENAERLGARVHFVRQDALNPPPDRDRWDVIVSNPPYICRREQASMHRNVTYYEPEMALFVPDEDPLRFYRAISGYATEALRVGGLLCFEINPRYWADIADMLSALGFTDVEVGKDAFGHERFVIGRRRKDDLTTDKDRPGQGGNN